MRIFLQDSSCEHSIHFYIIYLFQQKVKKKRKRLHKKYHKIFPVVGIFFMPIVKKQRQQLLQATHLQARMMNFLYDRLA